MHIKESRRSLPSAAFHATTGKSLTAGSARHAAASLLKENYEHVNVCSRPKINNKQARKTAAGGRLTGSSVKGSQGKCLRFHPLRPLVNMKCVSMLARSTPSQPKRYQPTLKGLVKSSAQFCCKPTWEARTRGKSKLAQEKPTISCGWM